MNTCRTANQRPSNPSTVGTTRLAPSPTGALHLGNLRTFLINWIWARQNGWRIVLRMDDLDGPRIKPGADRQAMEILQWIGLDWDEGPIYESQLMDTYQAVLRQLAAHGVIYPCRCTRAQIHAASVAAPHADQHETRYPGTCRPAVGTGFDWNETRWQNTAWRYRAPPGEFQFVDQFRGAYGVDVSEQVGDFLVATRSRYPAYQLAVVIDDHVQGVNEIVRGDDLLDSTPRQLLLQRELGYAASRYWHLPIVVGADGRRLAKRHGDTRIDWYRQRSVPVDRLLGLMADWCGLQREPTSLDNILNQFHMESLSRQRIVFSLADHDWLLEKK